MVALPVPDPLPLKMDEYGALRVSGTRVTLDTLIGFYQQGESPAELHDGFPTVPLADIYAVLAYYLSHKVEVDAYLKKRAEIADRIRQEWEARNPPPPTRAELQARLDNKRHAS